MSVQAIAPNTVPNDRPVALTVIGANFGSGLGVAVGGSSLTSVQVHSPSDLTATLTAGLCPGTYTVTVTNPGGHQASGGHVTVQGRRAAIFGPPVTSSAIRLTGADQEARLQLPPLRIQDTTCVRGTWRLVFTISGPSQAGRGTAVRPRALVMRWPASTRVARAPFMGNGNGADAVLLIPHTEREEVTVNPQIEIAVPANSFAGSSRVTVTVSLSEAP